jgi:hypothetical protein
MADMKYDKDNEFRFIFTGSSCPNGFFVFLEKQLDKDNTKFIWTDHLPGRCVLGLREYGGQLHDHYRKSILQFAARRHQLATVQIQFLEGKLSMGCEGCRTPRHVTLYATREGERESILAAQQELSQSKFEAIGCRMPDFGMPGVGADFGTGDFSMPYSGMPRSDPGDFRSVLDEIRGGASIPFGTGRIDAIFSDAYSGDIFSGMRPDFSRIPEPAPSDQYSVNFTSVDDVLRDITERHGHSARERQPATPVQPVAPQPSHDIWTGLGDVDDDMGIAYPEMEKDDK